MKNNTATKSADSRPFMEELERRVLLSADVFGAFASNAVYQDVEQPVDEQVELTESDQLAAADAAEHQTRELIIVDASTPDYEQLLADLTGNAEEGRIFEVAILDATENGVDQITELLSGYTDLDAVHLISHGDAGSIALGNSVLDYDALIESARDIEGWGDAFTAEGDLLIYGCNLAATEQGQDMVDALARLTEADVAASDDLTGAAGLGGDWDLEYRVGEVGSSVALSGSVQSAWQQTLATFVVDNTADSGAGSLRQAIIDANANANGGVPHVIAFDIGADGSQQTINLLSALDPINEAVIIDGYSQYGALPPTGPIIEINGAGTTNAGGLTLGAGSDGSTIRGLVINQFDEAGLTLLNSDNHTVVGNYIGTDITGTLDRGNGTKGLQIENSSGNQIGGASAADRNVIAANGNDGIILWGAGSTLNVIQGNYIGVDATGDAALGNGGDGIAIAGGANNNTIGGDRTAGEGNVISGQTGANSDGIEIDNVGANNNKIYGNYIGTNHDGTAVIANARHGVVIYDGVQGTRIGGTGTGQGNIISGNGAAGVVIDGNGKTSTTNNVIAANYIGVDATGSGDLGNGANGVYIFGAASGNLIGGETLAAGNIIAFSGQNGVEVVNGTSNSIVRNSIYSNTLLGIDLGSGANNNQAAPVLTSATTNGTQVTIDGTLGSAANTSFRIEFYSNATGDATGYGEGQTLIGILDVTTDAFGNASLSSVFSATVSGGSAISATVSRLDAGDAETDTSGFAQNVIAVATNAAPSISGLYGDVLNYTEGDGQVLLEQGGDALVSDIDSADFAGGSLGLEIDSGLVAAEDVFSIRNQGTGAGQIGIAGNDVTYSGVVIGSFTGGTGVTPLNVTFNSNATASAVTALIRNITYENVNLEDPTAGARSVTIDIYDGDGGASGTQNLIVNVAAVNDAPLVDLDGTNDAGVDFAVTFIEGAGPVALADNDAVVSDVDSTSFNGLSISFLGVLDGASEKFTVAGHTFSYGISDVVSRTVGGTAFELDFDGTGINIAREFGGLVPAADMDLLIRSISYENISPNPTGGDRTIAFVAVDDLGAPGVAANSVITVTSINDAPVLTNGITGTIFENGSGLAPFFINGTVSDPDSTNFDGGTLTFSVASGGDGSEGLSLAAFAGVTTSGSDVFVSGVQVGSFSGGTGGSDLVVSFNADATVSRVESVFKALAIRVASEDPTPGLRNLEVVLTDGDGGTSNTATASTTFNAVNDAPVLDNSGFMSLTTITEDDTNNSGDLVSAIIASAGGDRITDVDSGAVEGIAILGLVSGNGTWEYNTGSGWIAVGSVSETSSLLLRATDSLRFVPDGLNSDTGIVTFAAWDQTTGVAGTKVDTSAYGGSTAFSEVLDTAVITVTAANDAPTFFGNPDGIEIDHVGETLGQDSVRGATLQADGKVLVSSSIYDGTGFVAALTRYNVDGTIDTSFGVDGSVTLDVTGSNESFNSVTVQADGRIVAVGSAGFDLLVTRYEADGTLDATFGTGGVVVLNNMDYGQAVEILPTGEILVAGYSLSSSNFQIVRLDASGSLDPSFGTGGVVSTDTSGAGNADRAFDMIVQPDGRILVVGDAYTGASWDFAVTRYDANGTLDASFGSGGIALIDFDGFDDYGSKVALQDDGKIIVTGRSSDGSDDRFALVRLDANGALDSSFGTGGKVTADLSAGNDQATAIEILDDGRIMVAGTEDYFGSSSNIAILQFDTNGTLDPAFGSGGQLIYSTFGSDQVREMLIRADGSLLVVGERSGNHVVSQFSSSGVLDTNFAPKQTLDNTPTYIENGAPVVLDADVEILDAELSALDNFAGASLTLARNGGADAEDQFSATGSLGSLTQGANLTVGATTIGTVTTNSAGTLVLTFNGNATNALVNSTLQQIAYSNSSNTPPASVQIDWTFDDGNAGAQGSGGSLSVTGSTTVDITAANDAPIITSNGGGDTANVNVAENTTAVTTVTSSDIDGDTPVYSVSGGADGALFSVNGSTGELTFISAPDYETPLDANGDNVYEVIVQVADGNGGFDTQTINVTVTDVASNLIVTTTADLSDGDTSSAEALNASKGVDGAISLSEAITAANNSPETVTISFNITDPLVGGVHTFTVGAGGLPAITDTVIIDGTTDPDYAGAPIIELDGSSAGAGINGLTLAAGSDGSTIRGLVINRFTASGVRVDGSDNNTIVGNYIGTDGTGNTQSGNDVQATGITINDSSGNTIGGTTAGDANVLSGNRLRGVIIVGSTSTDNVVSGNFIGTNADGSAALTNVGGGQQIGVYLYDAPGNTIGGTDPGAGNIISGNTTYGIYAWGPNTTGNVIQGNIIGLDASQTTAIGNGNAGGGGILFSSVSGNIIGGTVVGAANVIAGHLGTGVLIGGVGATGNTILANEIYDNGALGIDLGSDGVTANDADDADTGLNDLQNFPVITLAELNGTDLTLDGSLDTDGISTQYRIEFFGNAAGTQDATNGEASVYLGTITVTTDGSGDASFSSVTLSGVTLGVGDYVTATATRIDASGQVGIDDQLAYGSTSEFCANVAITLVNAPPAIATTGSSLAYTENDGAVIVDSGLTITDADNTDLTGATVRIASGFFSTEDSLNFVDQLGITGSYNGGTGVLTLTGTASVADYQTALRSITYQNSSEIPSTANRSINFQVTDGAASSGAVRIVTVASINDDPYNAGSLPTDVSVTEDLMDFVDLSSVTLADVDASNNLITVTLTTSTGGKLWASSDFDVTVFGAGTGTLTLSGGVSDLNNFFSSAFRFQYQHGTTNTAGDNADSIQITINDGGSTGAGGGGNIDLGTVNVDITPVNDAPLATIVVSDYGVNEDEDYRLLSGISVSDVDAATNELAVTLSVNNGLIKLGDTTGLTFTTGSNDSASMTFTGTATDLNAALATVSYKPDADYAGTDFITLLVDDQGNTGGGARTDSATANIVVNAVNDAPVRTAGSVNNLTVLEDSGLTSLGLGGLAYGTGGGTDESSQTLTYEVTAIPDSNFFGKIYLADGTTEVSTGFYTLAEIQGMQFAPTPNASGGPAFFGFRIQDSGGTADGGADSISEFIQLNIMSVNDVPVVTATGGAISYNEQDPATVIDAGLTISDPDGMDGATASDQFSAVVKITGNYSADDLLAFTDTFNIQGSLAGDTLTLSVKSGETATIADFEAALRSVTFYNGSDTPSELDRVVSFTFDDGVDSSNTATRLVQVIAIDDAPVITSDGGGSTASLNVMENATAVTTVVATDAESDSITFSISGGADAGLFAIDSITGELTFISAPDYENAADFDLDNVYEVEVTATANGITDSQLINVTVTDADDVAPVVTINSISTSDNTPQLSGTVDDPTATVQVTVNGNTYTATNNGDGTWILADNSIAPALADGTYDVSVSATDAVGNVGSDASVDELVVDTTAPIVTVNALSTSDNTPQLTGTVSDPAATVEVTVNGSTYTATNNGDGTWTLADNSIAPALADGTYDVSVTATDSVGNAGADASIDELIVDTTAPVVTITGLTTADNTPQLSGTVSDPAATVEVTVNGNTYTATNNGDGTWTLANDTIAPALADGTYDISVTATDAVGNVGSDASIDELVIDTTAPVVTVTSLSTADNTPALSGTVSDPTATVEVTVNGSTYTATNNGNGTWTLADNSIAPALADGTYDVSVSATDAVGNVGSDASIDELVVDTTAPVVTVTGLSTADNTPQLTGTVSDPTAMVEVTVNGSTYAATNNGDGTWTLADNTIAPALADGTYDVSVSATDSLGNVGSDASVNELVVDTTAPVVTVTSLGTSDNTPQLTGTVSDPTATVEVTVNGSTYIATNNGDGTWTLADNSIAPALADGTYDVSVSAADAVGNVGSDASVDELVIDTTAPVVTVTSLSTSDNTPQLAGTVNDPTATVEVTVNGSTYTATNNGDGTWTLTDNSIAPALADGTYDVSVSATDAVGNVGSDGSVDELLIDTTAPIVTVNGLSTADNTPQLTGTVSDPTATVEVTVNGSTYTATNNGDGTWTLADNSIAPALADGTYDVSVSATDSLGNFGTDASVNELVVDTTAPVVTVNGLSTADNTPQLTGTVSDPTATVEVTVNGSAYTATNNGDGTWTLADNSIAPALADGTYDVSVAATDALGNIGSDASVDELVVDTTAPVVTVSGLSTADNTPQITGTISDPSATVEVTVNGSTYTATNNGDGTWTLADNSIAPALADGTYDVTVTATDTVGNVGNDASVDELLVDTTAPVVTVLGLTTADNSPALTGTVSDPTANVQVMVDGVTYTATNNGDGTWTLADNAIVPALVDGTYDVSVSATDGLGNVGSDSSVDELVIDTTAPVVTVLGLTTADDTPALTGTVNDPTANVEVTVNGTTYTATNNGDGTWTLADNAIAPALADGTYDVSVTATDGVGNVGSDASIDELVVDTSAPVVTVTSVSTADNTPQLTGTVSDPTATVEVTVNGSTYTATNNGDGTWTLADNTIAPALADGTYDVSVTATDGVGNVGSDASIDELVVDTTAPVVTVTSVSTADNTPQLTGTVSDPTATVEVTVDGTTYTATNNGDGTWTLADNSIAPALADGTYDVSVTAMDTLGNAGSDGSVDELVVDTTAPIVTVDGLTTADRTPALTGTVDDPAAVVQVTVNGSTYTASNNGDGTWTLPNDSITPALAIGTYDVSVTATDSLGNAGSDASVDELVISNTRPVAGDDAYTTDEDLAFTAVLGADDLLLNDIDSDGDVLVVNTTPVSGPNNGTLALNSDGTFTYTPNTNFNGNDSFTYEISDGQGGTAQATVTIFVNPVNDGPIATDDAYTTSEDQPIVTLLGVDDLLFNDSDLDGDPLVVNTTPVASPTNGSLVLNSDGTFTYTPNADFSGSDSFVYEILDGNGGTSQAVVNITVNPVNDAPTTVGIADVNVNEDAPNTIIDLLSAFDDVDDGAGGLTFTLTQNTNPALVNLANINAILGTLTLGYATDANGSADITVRATDSSGAWVESSFTVNVAPVNDAPVAGTYDIQIDEDMSFVASLGVDDLLLGATDVDGDALSVNTLPLAAPSNGIVALNSDGTFTYTPNADFNGTDSFTYEVVDGNGGVSQGVVTVTVNPVNDMPVAVSESLTINEDEQLVGSSGPSGLLSNDIDVDGDALRVNATPVSGPSNGTLVLNGDGSFTYTPNANFNGADAFSYLVEDGNGGASEATVNITVSPVNDAPVGGSDSLSMPGEQVTAFTEFSLLLNDTDVDGDTLQIVNYSQPSQGSLSQNPDGTFTYTPFQGFAGIDSFTYTVSDGAGAQDTVVVFISVAAPTNQTGDTDPTTDPGDDGTPPGGTQDPGPAADNDTGEGGSGGGRVPDEIVNPVDPGADEPTVVLDEHESTELLQAQTLNFYVSADEDRNSSQRTGTPPKFLYDALQAIETAFDVAIPDLDLASLNELPIWKALELMKSDMSLPSEEETFGGVMVTQMTTGVSLVLSAGLVSWLLRGGALASAFLSTMPVWQSVDPLPVLLAKKKRRRNEEDSEARERQILRESEVDRLFQAARRAGVTKNQSESNR